MGTSLLDTDFNQAPYFDDYNSDKQYVRVISKPSFAVQARELTTVQTMLQDQITKFGQNIFVNGTIISGCHITFNTNFSYVKVLDTYANGTALSVSDLTGFTAVSNSGLKAYVAKTQGGFVSQPPNLNTLFVSYLNSATNTAIKVFQNDEVLSVYTTANVLIGQITVANTISSGSSNTTGNTYAMSVDKGVVFQKGIFLTVEPQSLIVTPYSGTPDGLSVGFNCVESIVTSFQDQSLLDNAQGAPNYAAPGADRLKIVPTLLVRNTNSVSTDSFFSIVDFVAGSPSYVNQDTQYATIGAKMAEISDETNGNFIINPFSIRALQNFFANGTLDSNNIKLEVDSGLAYVKGYRVNLLGKLLTTVAKGTTVLEAPSQILTTQMGNFVQVQEFGGTFNPTILQQVSLRDTAAYAVSNNLAIGVPVNSISAPGAEIGKANILAVEFDNGTLGLNTCVYDLYLFNIQMNTGKNFTSVRSFYANSGGNLGFADVILTSGSFTLFDPSLNTLVYSFNQQAIKTLETAANTVDTQFEFVQSSNISISNTGAITINIPSSAGGINQLPFGAGTLTNLQKDQFILTSETTVATSNLAGSVANNVSANALTGTTTTFSSSLYPGCYILIANSTVSEVRQVSSITNNTVLSLTANLTHAWTTANVALQYQAGMEIPTFTAANVAITVGNSTSFSVALNRTFATALNATILYPIQRTVASPASKQLQTSVFIKINLANNVGGIKGPWSLGIPDVFEIDNIWYGSSYANTNPLVTNQFTLNNGQTDQYYGPAYLTANGAALVNTNVLLIQAQAYLKSVSLGAGFFSVDSYPVDDTGVTANSIFTQDIQKYVSIANSKTYDLRNSADFRFYTQNTIPYISDTTLAIANTLIVNPANTLTFSTTNLYIPVPSAEFESSLQYYVGRYDVLGLDTKGNIVINEGVPAENPNPPHDIQGGITLATMKIPPYPTLTQDIVNVGTANTNSYVSTVYSKNKRYRMSDVSILDDRISKVEYYSSLNVLEQSAQNLLLTNAQGNTRFQNGILADPMADYSISNILDPEMNISIDPILTEARPTFREYAVSLNYSNALSSNVFLSNDGSLLLLNNTQNNTPFISQPFASQERNCSQDILYRWTGKAFLTPNGNYAPDVTTNPPVTWGTWNEVGANSIANVSFNTITNVYLQPFIPAMQIEFTIIGLKPSTQFWTFLDDTPVSQYCIQTDSTFNPTLTGPLIIDFGHSPAVSPTPSSKFTSDANGTVYGIFYLPGNTFYTGERNFQIIDVSNLVTQTNIITSIASATFHGTNLAYTQQQISLLTQNQQTSPPIITPPPVPPGPTPKLTPPPVAPPTPYQPPTNHYNAPGPAGNDPIAQAFTVMNTYLASSVQGVYIRSIDVYFAAIDPVLGITLTIRDMVGGVPGINIQRGSQVHILPSAITTSQNASVATNIVFPAPVFLEAGVDYCFVLAPDGSNPNYDVWTGVISGKDVTTNSPIYALSAGGDMFLSSQNTTWTPYQNEAIKFNLYVDVFSPLTGTAVFVNDDSEYLSIANTSRLFWLGEPVFYSNTVLLSSNVSVANNSNNVTCNTTGILSGSKIYIQSNTNNATLVANIVSISSGTVLVLNTIPQFTDANASMGRLTSNGGLSGVVKSTNSSTVIIANSTANSTVFLSVNNGLIIGSQSLASATISSLNDMAYDTLMPKFAISVPSVCTLSFNMIGTANAACSYATDSGNTALTFGQSTDFLDKERVIMSKSNEVNLNSGNKSLKIYGNMGSGQVLCSPGINTSKTGAYTVFNLVNFDDANNDILISEITTSGNAINKYVSTTVILTPGLEADDLVVYVGAYYPQGTQILTYCKLLNQYDPDPFNLKSWTPMVTTNVTRSSSINVQDFNEYLFTLPTSNTGIAGVNANAAFLNTAYIDANNHLIATYSSNSGATYTQFNTFAVKIVLLANTSFSVPRLTDMRAIATTVST